MSSTACPCCGRPAKTGQATLTDNEIRKLPMGNQNTKWNVVRWQAVKGAAMYYEVSDWTAKVDSSLGYTENIALMAEYGTNMEATGGKTMREMKTPR